MDINSKAQGSEYITGELLANQCGSYKGRFPLQSNLFFGLYNNVSDAL